jgi:hypothetical protein
VRPKGGPGDNRGRDRGQTDAIATMGLVEVTRPGADGACGRADETRKQQPDADNEPDERPAEPDR